MAKKCTKCNFSNKDEALYCAECGAKLNTTGGGVFTFEKWFLGIAIVVFVVLVSYDLFNEYDKNQRLETEKIEQEKALIAMITTDIDNVKIEELSTILKRTKNTFETTKEFEVSQKKALDEILFNNSVGTATLENYNADTGHITTKLSWHKGIDILMDKNPPKSVQGYIKKDIAKSIFLKGKTRFNIEATVVNSKIHIGFIYAYVLSNASSLKAYPIDGFDNSVLISLE